MDRKKLAVRIIAAVAACALGLSAWAFFYTGAGEYAPPLNPSDTTTPFPFPEIEENYLLANDENADVVGWLYLPGTTINEAVVQTTNNDYYLRRNSQKRYSYAGSYFLDYRALLSPLSQNNVIYGHNLGSPMGRKDDPEGEKFAQLLKFEQEEFAKNTPYMYMQVDGEEMVFQIFSVFYGEAYTTPVEYHHDSYGVQEFQDLLADLKDRSLFDYDVTVGAEDKLLTLSTCTYKYGSYSQNPNQRFVVVGRLVQAGESYQQTADITQNADVKMPPYAK